MFQMNRTRSAPDEVLAPPADSEEYKTFLRATDLRAPYRIADDCLRGTQKTPVAVLETPLLVFINARSGGRVGPRLAVALSRALGKPQVFDLAEHTPRNVLQTLWRNLDALDAQGDAHAKTVRHRLRILAAGGDGTIAWIMNTIRDLKLDPPPPVAIIPLGTGNDLSRSFGWGKAFLHKWISNHENIFVFLKTMADAAVCDLDGWSVSITLPNKDLFKDKPHSLSVGPSDGPVQMQGVFWNYFSVGLDAKSALFFHRLREWRPWLASGRLINQFWYSVMSCKAGWFCHSLPLVSKVKLEVQRQRGGPWEELAVPSAVRALVLLNLQSYAGGRNIWGNHGREQRFQKPDFSDGMLEVVGFTNGYHTAVVMASKGTPVHCIRIAQVSGVRMKIRSSRPHPAAEPSCTYMQMDGEPWSQFIPSGDQEGYVQVEVSYAGTAKVLVNRRERPRPVTSTALMPTITVQQTPPDTSSVPPPVPSPAPPSPAQLADDAATAAAAATAPVPPLPSAQGHKVHEDANGSAAQIAISGVDNGHGLDEIELQTKQP